jgi:phage baseplate assembly protein W
MQENVLYKDLDLSLTPHPLTGDILPKINAEAIKRSLRHLLLWEKWDVPFSSVHHNHLRDELFEFPSNPIKATIRSKVEWLIKAFEPRVKIQSIDVDLFQDEAGYEVTIAYTIRSLLIEDKISFYIQRVR